MIIAADSPFLDGAVDFAVEIHSGQPKIESVNDFLFYYRDGVDYLVGYRGDKSDLVLPEDYHGAPYEIKKYTFYGNSSLTSVTLSERVSAIGDYSFASCMNLKSVDLGHYVKRIGNDAFQACPLTEIILPASVTYMGVSVFVSTAKDFTIYCEADTRPEGWDANWNRYNYNVVWGYNG